MSKRKTRKSPPRPRHPARFEADDVMYALCGLAKGERVAVAGGDLLVLTRRGDPAAGALLPAEHLAALEARGWVAASADGETAGCTPEGRKWASIWFNQRHGCPLDHAIATTRSDSPALLAARGSPDHGGK